MLEKIEPGVKIGKLTAVGEAEAGKRGGKQWLCKCDCGNTFIANEKYLLKHMVASCGCSHRGDAPDIIGSRFGRLIVLYHTTDNPEGKAQWVCQCDCGNIAVKTYRALTKNSKVPSCGCYNAERTAERNTTHGLFYSPLHTIWAGMRQRCHYPKCISYKYYGARGIYVCDRWRYSFQNFYDDMSPTYKEGLQLDRIDSNGPYSPENCRWVTVIENQRNSSHNHLISTAIGRKPVSEQAEISGVPDFTIHRRLKTGIPEEYAILPSLRNPGWKRAIEAIKKLYAEDYPAIWLNDEMEDKIFEVVDTANIQAKAIKDWGFGPAEIILGDEE